MRINLDNYLFQKVLPGVMSGVVTAALLYYMFPQVINNIIGQQGIPRASAVHPMNAGLDVPIYYPCVACEREMIKIW